MAAIRLLLDEDVRPLLAEVLRDRGYDAVAVVPEGLSETEDERLLEFAAEEKRTFLTHNVRDFVPLATEWAAGGRSHAGIVVSDRLPFKVLLARTLRLLSRKSAEEMENTLEWLQNYR